MLVAIFCILCVLFTHLVDFSDFFKSQFFPILLIGSSSFYILDADRGGVGAEAIFSGNLVVGATFWFTGDVADEEVAVIGEFSGVGDVGAGRGAVCPVC